MNSPGIGERVARTEDPKLLRGEGRYTDDVNEPRQAYACMVRSQYAHGVLKGVDAAKVAEAFAKAAHVTKLSVRNTRVVVAAMEPRSAVCKYEGERFTLTCQGQGVFAQKNQLADILGVKPESVRVVTPNVGGSFGMKGSIYPEYVCLAHAAKALGRPVKWTDERAGSFLSDQHGRDHEMTVELALDKEAKFLALRVTGHGNVGAWVGTVAPQPPTRNAVRNVCGVYKIPLLEVSTKAMLTNTTPVSAYRGAGRPEANYYMERLCDEAAREMGIDRFELRRRNHLKPAEIPYKNAAAMTVDSGDFGTLFEKALAAGDVAGFARRREESKRKGKLRGLGVGSYMEVTAPPNKEMGGIVFDNHGGVTMISGTLDYGQGHAAPFAQGLHSRLRIPFEKVRLVQGDSDQIVFGAGTGGSRSAMMGGGALAEASKLVIEKSKEAAGEALEAAAADIEVSDGKFRIAGTDRTLGIMELARKYSGRLDVKHVTGVIPSALPHRWHAFEVEIDPDTGKVDVVRYHSVNDFGTVLNPLMTEGQVHGGVVQGIGQCLMESARYDEEGQLLTGSFMDYALPRAEDIRASIEWASHPVPATTNPLGAKGCGEAGCAGSMTSVMNAIVDALRPLGIHHFAMPASPPRVWEAIRNAK